MNTKIIWVLVGLVLVVGVLVLGSRQTSGPTDGSLKIGVIAPLTGDFGAVGENVVKGIRVAQAVHAENTGITIPIIIENDSADAAKGLSAYKKLTEVDQVTGLINTFTSTMDAIYPSVQLAGYPVMMEFLQANNVAKDNVFQMTLGNEHVWDRYAKYISESNYDQSKVVIIHSIDAAQASFVAAFTSAYGKSVTTVVASSDKNTLRSDAVKVAALKPTMVILFMTPDNGAILTKELLPLINPSVQLAYDIQITTGLSSYQQQLGGDLSKINGAIALMFEGDMDSSEYKEFLVAFKKLYPNEEPGFLADYGYDTFMTYVSTYNKDSAKWIANLETKHGMGASGEIKFDGKGVRISPLVIKKVIGGKLETTDRLPLD